MLAFIHGGTFAHVPSIEECLRTPHLSEMWGVEKPSTIESPAGKIEFPIVTVDFIGNTFEIYRHPLFFISQDVLSWFSRYKNRKGIKRMDYQTEYLFFDAIDIYENALMKYTVKK